MQASGHLVTTGQATVGAMQTHLVVHSRHADGGYGAAQGNKTQFTGPNLEAYRGTNVEGYGANRDAYGEAYGVSREGYMGTDVEGYQTIDAGYAVPRDPYSRVEGAYSSRVEGAYSPRVEVAYSRVEGHTPLPVERHGAEAADRGAATPGEGQETSTEDEAAIASIMK